MANRPGALCNLTKGKAIGSQTGFVDTFNWLKDCLKNLKAGRGIKISWPSDDTPEISLDGGNENGDGESGGGGDTAAVYDVSKSYNPQTGNDELTITYTDDRADKKIELNVGGDASVTFFGTDGLSGYSTNTFQFESATDSNISVSCQQNNITIGVYYL